MHVTPAQVDLGTGPKPAQIDDPVERQYEFRETRVRAHQAHFRRLVQPPKRCAVCSLRQERLLDAAHIVGDLAEQGEPVISNGLSLCSIHHRAFDNPLVGISPDYEVHVSRRLLEDDDGPMLDLLKRFHRAAAPRTQTPRRTSGSRFDSSSSAALRDGACTLQLCSLG